MLHRIRESLVDNNSFISYGIAEVDETYMSRKYVSEYQFIPPEESARLEKITKKRNLGAVLGIKHRGGKIVVKAAERANAKAISDVVKANVSTDVQLMTDEALKYRKVLKEYNRQTTNHSNGEWVRGKVHTNGVENFWSVRKRGIHGIYHKISYKHLQNYCNEFAFRFNTRDLIEGNRFKKSFKQINCRTTYKQLTEK